MMVKSGTYNCPCCGLFGLDRFVNENGDHVCDDCGWIKDWDQLLDPNLEIGKNPNSLKHMQKEYFEWINFLLKVVRND